MARVNIVNRVFRLKRPHTLTSPSLPNPLNFKGGDEFHIVADVVYMGGFPLPANLQKFITDWIMGNQHLFVEDTRHF